MSKSLTLEEIKKVLFYRFNDRLIRIAIRGGKLIPTCNHDPKMTCITQDCRNCLMSEFKKKAGES